MSAEVDVDVDVEEIAVLEAAIGINFRQNFLSIGRRRDLTS